MTIRELSVQLGLDVDTQSFAKGQLLAEGLKGVLTKIVEFGEEAVSKFTDVIQKSIELGRAAQFTGIATQALQELRHAAERSGVDVESLNTSVFRLAHSIGEASKGTGAQADAFRKLGVHLKDSDGKLRSTDEIIMSLADGFAAMPDSLEKTGLAMAIFGRAGGKMIPMLNRGKEGIAKLRDEAIVLSDESIKLSQKIKAKLNQMHEASERFWTRLVERALPYLNKLLGWTIKATKGLSKFLHENSKAVMGAIGGLTLALAIYQRQAIIAALRTAAAWALAALPFVTIAAVIGAMLLLMDDLRVYMEGGDSLLGDLKKKLDAWLESVNTDDVWWLQALKDGARIIRELIRMLDEFNDAWGRTSGKTVDRRAGLSPGAIQASADAQTFATMRRRVGMGLSLTDFEQATLNRASIPASSFMEKYGPNAPNMSMNVTVNQSPGMSAQEVVGAIEQHWQSQMSDAGAHSGGQ